MYNLRSAKKPRISGAKTAPTPTPTHTPIPAPALISLLVSHFQGLKSLKPVLKLLYSLICSSLSYEVCQGNCGNSAPRNGFVLKLEDKTTLSDILFEELHKRLLFSSDAEPMDQNVVLPVLNVVSKDSGEELLLLLRCCILLARLHPFTVKLEAAVSLLRRLSFQGISSRKEGESIMFSKLVSSQSTYCSFTKSTFFDFSAKSESSDSYLHILQQMQEVYLDEMFADRQFRDCISISDSVFSTYQNPAVCSSIQIESVLDIIAAHFLTSFSGKDVYTLIKGLIWTKKPFLSSSEVSLPVALSLINHPVMASSPIPLRSHLISLAAEVISICKFPEKEDPNVMCLKKYPSTFVDSVILYCEHMSKLMTGSCSPGRDIQRPFNSCFRSKIYEMLADWDNAWSARNNRVFNKTLSSSISAISYIKMNIYIVDEPFRDVVFSFLSSLIARLTSIEIGAVLLQRFEEMSLQDFYLLASILKLMGCSLLQGTRSANSLNCLIALLKRKDALPVYNSSRAGVMSFFALYKFPIPIEVQLFIVDALKPHFSKYEEFELMFVHFSGLLSLCMVSGLHVLMKGCLFLMLVLVKNLPLESRTESSTCAPSQSTVTSSNTGFSGISQKYCVRPSSHKVASNFRRERRNLLRVQKTSDASEISDEETCNGEIFLKCVLNNNEDVAELADFIECKPWRDYNAWLLSKVKRRRKRFQMSGRKLQLKKMQALKSVK